MKIPGKTKIRWNISDNLKFIALQYFKCFQLDILVYIVLEFEAPFDKEISFSVLKIYSLGIL